MQIWGRRPPSWHFAIALALVFATALALRTVFSLEVTGGITAAQTYFGLWFRLGFSKGKQPR
ncbi:MAG TPA: hypothetical protein VGL75_15865 [Acidothermaceae bacterium]